MTTPEEKHAAFLRGVSALTEQIDLQLNGHVDQPSQRKVGFVLLMFPLGVPAGNCTMTNNGLHPQFVMETLRAQADAIEMKIAAPVTPTRQ